MAITLNGSTGITTDIDGDESLTLNRDTSDGDIITLQKDNTTVGSIIAASGDIALGNGTVGVKVHSGVSSLIPYNLTAISSNDNAIDIGYSTNRFKDLYLSGGVYLGGTTSANALDDYEEGTWNPTDVSGAGIGLTVSNNRYTKIGRLVIASAQITIASNSSSTHALISLPFTGETQASETGGMCTEQNYSGSDVIAASCDNAAYLRFRLNGNASMTWSQISGTKLRFTVTYHAA